MLCITDSGGCGAAGTAGANQIEQIEAAVAALERQLLAWHKANVVSQRLATIPGIGPIIATAIASTVADPNFAPGGSSPAAHQWGKREFAAIEGDESRSVDDRAAAASDFCAAREVISCQAGAIHT